MDGTVSDYDEAQTEVRRVVIKNAHKAIFIFDSTKLDKTESINLCTLSESDTVIIPRGNCFSVHTEN